MPDKSPQNPVFTVDPSMLEACLPKIICGTCGTVIGLSCRQPIRRIRCPVCATALVIDMEEIQPESYGGGKAKAE